MIKEESMKVSIVVPTRNRHMYIRQAIQSVLTQDYPNWRLIIVDDASTDDTDKIICEFIEDERIVYIRNEEHIGISKARNQGIEKATGKYIVFLDSDDVLPPDALKIRVNQIEQEHANLAQFAFYVDNKNNSTAHVAWGSRYCTNKEFLARISESQVGKTVGLEYVWDKIFDLNIIKEQGIRFDETTDRFEDRIFVMDYLRSLDNYENRILISEAFTYHYEVHEGSISRTYDPCLLRKLRDYYIMLKAELKNYGIFEGEVAAGYYHSYINKIIGMVIEYLSINQGDFYNSLFYEELVGDKNFLQGLAEYQCRNQHETEDTLNMLKELMRPFL